MSQASKSELKVIFGAMTFGREGVEQARITKLEDCAQVLDVFKKYGHNEIDTARIYGDGSCEELLGQLNLQDRGLIVDTKLSPIKRFPAFASAFTIPTYTHEPHDLKPGVLDSLKALKTDKVDLWYLHAPDHATPYEDTLREVNNIYKEGYFRRLGICNYSAWEVAQICEICIRNGWKKPDVYQGVYNALHRGIEDELIPCLRHYGIEFYAYNPLAGGFLTDRYQREGSDRSNTGERFDPKSFQGTAYRQRYWNDAYFDALDIIRPLAKKLGMTTAEAALRWANHHSAMKKKYGDAVIIGASSAMQLEENLTSLDKGPLPEEMVKAFDEGWKITKPIAKLYFF
ncbi:NADP-dependent oxidoreductase domain-containing protein [Xylogone sp. PMI_703]|nr:NADP-dependent oxidoreductase domain-containing protein [Xylogone sp. PMI_703]